MNVVRLILAFFASLVAMILLIPVLIMGLPFWFIRFIQGRIASLIRVIRPIPSTWDELIQFYPGIGWKPKPNLKTFATDMPGNRYSLSTDKYGWRTTHSSYEESDIFVFGDSFAFGFGANDDEFFANIYDNSAIKAIGANGYNLVQEYLLMEKHSKYLKNRTVIWFIYHGNDLYENLTPNLRHYRMPFVREINNSSDWEIVNNHVNPTPWPINEKRDYYAALANICSQTFLSERAFSACNYLIKKGKDLCERENADLIIFSLPDIAQIDESRHAELAAKSSEQNSFDPDLPDRKLKGICEQYAIPFYSTKDSLTSKHFISGDVHWNAEGNKKIARLIKKAVNSSKEIHEFAS